MGAESAELCAAREHLAKAEAAYRTADGLFHLEEGLMLLDDLATGGAAHDRTVARNVAATYADRIYGSIARLLEADRAVPEPLLEHLFKVLLAFDHGDFVLPANANVVKVSVARRLIDRYYEGHDAATRQQAVEQLMSIAQGNAAPGKSARRSPK